MSLLHVGRKSLLGPCYPVAFQASQLPAPDSKARGRPLFNLVYCASIAAALLGYYLESFLEAFLTNAMFFHFVNHKAIFECLSYR